jgi:2'-hydroxyisoflavone reductase
MLKRCVVTSGSHRRNGGMDLGQERNRREFLRDVGAAAGLVALVPRFVSAAADADSRTAEPMRVLILGGTGFIGPHLVHALTSRGHTVSIFTRGRRDAELPGNVERLVGDRAITDSLPHGDLRALQNRQWDAVIDDSATDPRWVRETTALLRDSDAYLFVSSTGVFNPYLTPQNAETDPVIVEPADSRDYGVQKAQSEVVVRTAFAERGLVIRPGYIVGPGDTTDRFPYWPQRLARGGETLAPGRRTDPTQFVDVRDLTAFMIRLIEAKRGGTYNVTGPRTRLAFGDFLDAARSALNANVSLIWADDYEFLRAQRIGGAIPWIRAEGNNAYHMQINNARAIAAGLTFRPIADTVRDTLAWWNGQPETRRASARFWITPEREREVIAAWKARR